MIYIMSLRNQCANKRVEIDALKRVFHPNR